MLSTDTYSSSFIHFGTMSQQNRQAFLVSFMSSYDESCGAILLLTAEAKKVTKLPFRSNSNAIIHTPQTLSPLVLLTSAP